MHTVALQLAPILGAEKSKVPFYIAGGVLVAWALLVSVGIGMRRGDFPSDSSQQRMVMAITAVLVLAAVSTAVITSGGSRTSQAASGSSSQATTVASQPAAGPSSSTQPTATTGTPNPASSPAAGSGPVLLVANPEGQLSYDTKQLKAKAGSVTIALANGSPVEHNVTIAQGSKVLAATPSFAGGSRKVTVALKPGKYTFYCSVPGHRQAGMEGTLTVS